jgi:hypothetical protein
MQSLRPYFFPGHIPREDAIAAIGRQCTALTSLDISYCSALSGRTLITARPESGIRAFASLRHLDIRGTWIASEYTLSLGSPVDEAQLVDRLRIEVLDAVPSLDELWLSWNAQLLERARWALPTLSHILVHLG